jgi:uncharacterized protein with HEPN domain
MLSSKARMALFDIRDNGKFAQDFIGGLSFDDFQKDRRTFHAVTRALEIVSEAARRLPPELHARHPDLPWRKITGVGNVYRHNYENVAEQQVWLTVHDYLPALLVAVDMEIEKLDDIT